MINYGFTVQVAGIDPTRDNYEDALYEAGCDDALVVVLGGSLHLDFHRMAATFDDAVRSASKDVEQAGGKVVKVAPLPD